MGTLNENADINLLVILVQDLLQEVQAVKENITKESKI